MTPFRSPFGKLSSHLGRWVKGKEKTKNVETGDRISEIGEEAKDIGYGSPVIGEGEKVYEQEKPVVAKKSPVKKPTAVRKAKVVSGKKAVNGASILDVFGNGNTLLNGPLMTITIDGSSHFMAFKNATITLDGKEFSLHAGRVELDLYEVKREGNTLVLVAGMSFKKGIIRCDETETLSLLQDLIKHGTHKCTIIKDDGQKELVEITRF